MIKNLSDLAAKLGIEEKLIRDAIESKEEIIIEMPETVMYSKQDFETYKTNLAKQSYADGKTAAFEMAVKEYKKDNNIDFQGKTIESVIDFLNKDFIAKSKNIDETARQAIANHQKEIEELKKINASYVNDINDIKVTNVLMSNHKLQSVKTKIPVEKIVKLYKSETAFDYQDQENIFIKNSKGEIIKDSKLNPVNVNDHFLSYLEQNDMIEKGGTPGIKPGSNGQKIFNSMDEIEDYINQAKIVSGSQDHIKIIRDSQKAGTLKN